jgi:hypothetical protein
MSHTADVPQRKPTNRAWLARLSATSESRVAIQRDAALSVVSMDLRDDGGDAINNWIVEAGTQLFAALRELVVDTAADCPRVCVLVVDPVTDGTLQPVRQAACAMVRGAVLSLGPERPESRLTMVRARPDQLDQLAATLDYLAGDEASYITGASLDLTQRR